MTLALVREEPVVVEELRCGDRIVLPVSKERRTVQRVDRFDDEYIVRCTRPAQRGDPGVPSRLGESPLSDYLSSSMPVPAGYVFMVAHDG